MIQADSLIPQVIEKYQKYNFPIKPVNLYGLQDERDQAKDVLNDLLGMYIPGINSNFLFKGTTNPGINARIRHPEGAAHLCYGTHPDIWVIGIHAKSHPSFAHEALVQRPDRGCQPCYYWRDVDHSFKQDDNPIFSSADCGCNWHRASSVNLVQKIGDYSDMCQVKQSNADHLAAMKMIKEVPEVAATKFIGDANRKGHFWNEETGVEYYSYLFGYLLTPIAEWDLSEVI